MTDLYIVSKERRFSPDRQIIDAIKLSLGRAERMEPGWSNDAYICILLSGTALEAIGNSFGEALISNWKDFESANTLAKLRIISEHLGIAYSKDQHPWNSACWLYKLRNKLAHPKPENLSSKRVVTEQQYDQEMYSRLKSKIEAQISIENARRSCSTVMAIRERFAKNIPQETAVALLHDSTWYTGSKHEG